MKNSKIEKLKKLLKSPGLSKGVRESTESQIEKLEAGLKKKAKPKIKAEVTDVIFIITDREDNPEDLFALFYNEKESNGKYSGYSEIGQHQPISLEYAKEGRLATPAEYKNLKKELESPPYGYNLVVAKSKSVLEKNKNMSVAKPKSALETAKEKAKAKKVKKEKSPERVENFRAFEVSYLGATNSMGSRVKIKDYRFKESKTISYDYKFNSTYEIAQDYLSKKGIKLIGIAEAEGGYILFTDNFDISIK